MNKIYKYEFVNETVEIEVSEEWEKCLKDEDKEEYNIWHKETRRHESLSMDMDGSDWLKDKSPELEELAVSDNAINELINKALIILTPKQWKAFEQVCLLKRTEAEYAKSVNISQPTAHEHVERAKEKLKKAYKKYF